jgi:hypothetical protein
MMVEVFAFIGVFAVSAVCVHVLLTLLGGGDD